MLIDTIEKGLLLSQQSFLLSKGVDIEQIDRRITLALISSHSHGRIVHAGLTGTVTRGWQIPKRLLLRLSHGKIGNVTVLRRLVKRLPFDIKSKILHIHCLS